MFLEDPFWLLAAPVAVAWALAWHRRRATGLSPLVSRISLVLWSIAAVAVAFAAAGPRVREQRPTPVEVMVLVDASESMRGPALDHARRYASEVVAASGGAVVRVAAFGRGLAWGDTTPDDSATDIGHAISLASALPPSGASRRMVVVTDANDTAGRAEAAAAAARAAGTEVHVVAIRDTAPELLVSSLEVPRSVRRGQTFAASARVEGTRAGPVRCTLAVGSGPPMERTVDFAPPSKSVRWTGLTVPDDELDRVRVRVQCRGADAAMSGWPQNDSRVESVEIAGKVKVWCMDDPGAQCVTLTRLLKDTADVLPVASQQVAGLATATRRPDVLAIGNTAPGTLPPLAEALVAAANAGVGMLFLGGERALSLAGLGGTQIERDLLPVFLNRREQEQGMAERAVIMVLDRSSSMAGQKIALAREAAIASVRALPKDTILGVIAFDTRTWVVLPPTPVGDASRAVAALASITVGGGTDILKALKAARDMMAPVQAVQRVVILLTDGASNPKDVVETAAAMGGAGIQVSTIAVGPEPDRVLLAWVAEATGGRHYWARSADAVPRLLLDEVTGGENAPAPEGKRSVVPASTPVARRVFRGVDPARLVPVEGLVHTEERPEGIAIASTETREPVAAIRRVGAGQVAVFTPGLEDRWVAKFLAVPDGARVVTNLLGILVRQAGSVEVRPGLVPEEDRIEVTADVLGPDGAGLEGAEVRARVTGPDGTTREVRLEPLGLGRHAATMPNDFGLPGSSASRTGTYSVVVSGIGPGPTPLPEASLDAGLAFPAELARFGANLEAAARIASAGGGRVDPSPSELFAGAGMSPFARPVEHLFLIPALALFVASVWVRRARL